MSDEIERGKSLDSRFNFYDYAGFIAPGTAFLLGLVYFVPEVWGLTEKLIKESSLGALGLFLLIAYVVGHLLEGVGVLIEKAMWWWHGRPHNWIRSWRIHKF